MTQNKQIATIKKLLAKVSIGIGLLLLSLSLLKNSLPYHWGNELLSQKITLLQNPPKPYNTLAIGSSFVYRHFIPAEFDQITKTTTSFNLGTQGMRFMESAYLLEQLLKDPKIATDSIDQILFLTQPTLDIPDHAVNTLRGNYWTDFKRTLLGLQYFSKDQQQIHYFLSSFVARTFSLGALSEMIQYYWYQSDILDSSIIDKDGFQALDDDASQQYRSTYFRRTNKGKPRKDFDKTYAADWTPPPITKEEQIQYTELLRLHALCAAKGIALHFIFLPNDVFHKKFDLPNELYLGDSKDIPFYFLAKNYFDAAHLNKQGASLLSRKLGNIYSRKLD